MFLLILIFILPPEFRRAGRMFAQPLKAVGDLKLLFMLCLKRCQSVFSETEYGFRFDDCLTRT